METFVEYLVGLIINLCKVKWKLLLDYGMLFWTEWKLVLDGRLY